jgi:hypothetical protein
VADRPHLVGRRRIALWQPSKTLRAPGMPPARACWDGWVSSFQRRICHSDAVRNSADPASFAGLPSRELVHKSLTGFTEPKLVHRQDTPAFAAAPLRRGILRVHS